MALEDLIRQRRDKILRWRELGVAPYAYSYDVTHHAADLIESRSAHRPGPHVGDVRTLR